MTRIDASMSGTPCEPWEGNYFVAAYPPFSTWRQECTPAVTALLTRSPRCATEAFGLYLHIPFCTQRCDYCYYLSYDDKSASQQTQYVDALLEEMSFYAASKALSGRRPSFVYFGGGTPSIIPASGLASLLRRIQEMMPWDRVEEATFECAPRTVTDAKMQVLKDGGITRLSMGVQSLDDDVLCRNGRVHTQRDAFRALEVIRAKRFNIVNIDLIVGLLGQTDDRFHSTLDRIIDRQPESVTLYQLELPFNTPMYRALCKEENHRNAASWAAKRARLSDGFDRLLQAGYTLRSGYTAVRDPERHPFLYQDAQYRGADLLGLGAASFSYLSGIHYQNRTSYEAYLSAVTDGLLPVARAYRLSEEERLVREFVLQLKLGGVEASYFRNKFDVDIISRFAEPLEKCRRRGWLTHDADGVRLSREGLLRVDRFIPDFYLPAHRGVPYA